MLQKNDKDIIYLILDPRKKTKEDQRRPIMDAVEFACFLERLQRSIGVSLDSELTARIYEQYEISYDNYTFFELFELLKDKGINITCKYNKKSLIEFIRYNNIDIPQKDGPMKPSEWKHIRYRKSLDCIDVSYFEFSDGDIIRLPDNSLHEIYIHKWGELISEDLPVDDPDSYKDVVYVYLTDMETQEEHRLYAEEFIEILDEDDVTIEQCINCYYYMNEQQKHYWEHEHIQWM